MLLLCKRINILNMCKKINKRRSWSCLKMLSASRVEPVTLHSLHILLPSLVPNSLAGETKRQQTKIYSRSCSFARLSCSEKENASLKKEERDPFTAIRPGFGKKQNSFRDARCLCGSGGLSVFLTDPPTRLRFTIQEQLSLWLECLVGIVGRGEKGHLSLYVMKPEKYL